MRVHTTSHPKPRRTTVKRAGFARQTLTRRAFTLIELLIVIAIIAILAAILFPVFARARENARRSSCMSNLKQLGLGVLQYVQDYDETFPFVYNYAPNNGTRYWSREIFPYVKSSQIYVCPSANAPASIDVTNAASCQFDVRYGMNNNDFGSGNPANIPVKLSYLRKPAELIWLIDTREGVAGWNPFLATYQCQDVDARHFEGANICFADGHVKWLKESAYRWYSGADSARVLKLWDTDYQTP